MFVGVAMEHQLPQRVAFVADLVRSLEAKGEIFYALKRWPTPDVYPSPGDAFRIVWEAIQASRLFCLYYPDKVPSGALVELGMALSLSIPSIIYTEDAENLSYFLRDSIPGLKVVTQAEEVLPWLLARIP